MCPKLYFIIRDKTDNRIDNSGVCNNTGLRDSLDTIVPGIPSFFKYRERILSFSYEESLSFNSSNLSNKLSQIFSENSNENKKKKA